MCATSRKPEEENEVLKGQVKNLCMHVDMLLTENQGLKHSVAQLDQITKDLFNKTEKQRAEAELLQRRARLLNDPHEDPAWTLEKKAIYEGFVSSLTASSPDLQDIGHCTSSVGSRALQALERGEKRSQNDAAVLR